MKHNVLILDENTLLEAMRKYGKGSETKDYEYAVSIYMKRYLEKYTNEKYSIVFETKPGKLDPRRNFKPTPEETIEILRTMLEEETLVDFGLVKGTIDDHEEYAYPFQAKKVYEVKGLTPTQAILNGIYKIFAKHYTATSESLIIVTITKVNKESDAAREPIDLEYIRKNLKVPGKSFHAIYLFLEDVSGPVITQLWHSEQTK